MKRIAVVAAVLGLATVGHAEPPGPEVDDLAISGPTQCDGCTLLATKTFGDFAVVDVFQLVRPDDDEMVWTVHIESGDVKTTATLFEDVRDCGAGQCDIPKSATAKLRRFSFQINTPTGPVPRDAIGVELVEKGVHTSTDSVRTTSRPWKRSIFVACSPRADEWSCKRVAVGGSHDPCTPIGWSKGTPAPQVDYRCTGAASLAPR
jgi:hypothetical protein